VNADEYYKTSGFATHDSNLLSARYASTDAVGLAGNLRSGKEGANAMIGALPMDHLIYFKFH
jgi:hypothetical protein